MGDASSEPVPDMRILKRKVALAGWPGGLGDESADHPISRPPRNNSSSGLLTT